MPGSHHAYRRQERNRMDLRKLGASAQSSRPQTGKDVQWRMESNAPINAPSFGNFTMSPDG